MESPAKELPLLQAKLSRKSMNRNATLVQSMNESHNISAFRGDETVRDLADGDYTQLEVVQHYEDDDGNNEQIRLDL